MFSMGQINEAHAKTKSGAGFPRYIADIYTLGVRRYIIYMSDGHGQYRGEGDDSVVSTTGSSTWRL